MILLLTLTKFKSSFCIVIQGSIPGPFGLQKEHRLRGALFVAAACGSAASQPSVACATSPCQGECGSTPVPPATPVVRIAHSFVAAPDGAFAASRLRWAENSTEFSAFALQAVRVARKFITFAKTSLLCLKSAIFMVSPFICI